MPTVEQFKKIAARTVATQGSEMVVYDNKSAFSMDNVGFTAGVHAVNEYWARDLVAPFVGMVISATGLELTPVNTVMLNDMAGELAADMLGRWVMSKPDKPWLEKTINYAVGHNIGDMLDAVVFNGVKTTV